MHPTPLSAPSSPSPQSRAADSNPYNPVHVYGTVYEYVQETVAQDERIGGDESSADEQGTVYVYVYRGGGSEHH